MLTIPESPLTFGRNQCSGSSGIRTAHGEAVSRDDSKNLTWIAESLAGFYVKTCPDRTNAEEWLARLELYLQRFDSEWEREQLALLRETLARTSGR